MNRRSIEIEGLRHLTAIPAASRLGPFLSSSVIPPFTPGTRTVPDDPQAQYANIFHHAAGILEAAGGGWANVLKMEFWAPSAAARDALEARWITTFPDATARPARHTHLDASAPPTASLLAVLDSPRPAERQG